MAIALAMIFRARFWHLLLDYLPRLNATSSPNAPKKPLLVFAQKANLLDAPKEVAPHPSIFDYTNTMHISAEHYPMGCDKTRL